MSLDDRNAELDKKLEENPIDEIVGSLVRADRRRKGQVRWLALSLALDVLLTLAFGWVTIQTHRISTKAESNQNAIARSCETSNEARKNNLVLWDYILEIPPVQPLTAEQLQQRDQFKVFVQKTFAQRDCQAEVNK